VNVCGTEGAANACERVTALRTNGAFFGTKPYIVVSEDTNSSAELTVRFKLTGTVTIPTLYSLSPNSAVGPTGTKMVKATQQNGNYWNSYAVFSKDSVVVGQSFCDPTSANECDFAVPAAALAVPGSYTVALKFSDIDGTPSTNSLPFTVTAAP
jgi:hypothetical protein